MYIIQTMNISCLTAFQCDTRGHPWRELFTWLWIQLLLHIRYGHLAENEFSMFLMKSRNKGNKIIKNKQLKMKAVPLMAEGGFNIQASELPRSARNPIKFFTLRISEFESCEVAWNKIWNWTELFKTSNSRGKEWLLYLAANWWYLRLKISYFCS